MNSSILPNDSKITAPARDEEFDNKETGNMWRSMLNRYYDFEINSAVTPYVDAGAGAGFALATLRHKLSGDVITIMNNLFAYQAMVGCKIAIAKNTNVNVEYRFTGTTKAEFVDQKSVDSVGKLEKVYTHAIMSHSANLGLTYMFA